MKVILVPVADRPECLVALNSAFDIASRLDANVIGCHVRTHRNETSRDSSRKPLVPDEWSNVLADLSPDEVSLRCEAARILFESRAEKHGFQLLHKPHPGVERSALWKEMVGTPSRILGIVGPLSDLIITARPDKKAAGHGKRSGQGDLSRKRCRKIYCAAVDKVPNPRQTPPARSRQSRHQSSRRSHDVGDKNKRRRRPFGYLIGNFFHDCHFKTRTVSRHSYQAREAGQAGDPAARRRAGRAGPSSSHVGRRSGTGRKDAADWTAPSRSGCGRPG